MKPLFHPQLVNSPFGDPALFIDSLFEHRALMFDLGEIQPLPPRKILRLSHIFISHTHMDHFAGFDRVLRIAVGRDRCLHLFGPRGLIEQVGHKLAAYTWNLVENYRTNFTLVVTEVTGEREARRAWFRCRSRFRREDDIAVVISNGVLLDEALFRVRYVSLDHRIPSLAFLLEEKAHINVWKNRLDELGLPTGAWLRELKTAVLTGRLANDAAFPVWWREGGTMRQRYLPFGFLKQRLLHVSAGQRIGYVTDCIYSEANSRRITSLMHGADILFIEAGFSARDAAHAANAYHLTAGQAGDLARRAGVARVVPFHFSARYAGDEALLRHELEAAFNADGTN